MTDIHGDYPPYTPEEILTIQLTRPQRDMARFAVSKTHTIYHELKNETTDRKERDQLSNLMVTCEQILEALT